MILADVGSLRRGPHSTDAKSQGKHLSVFQVVEITHRADAFDTVRQSRCHIDKIGFHDYLHLVGKGPLRPSPHGENQGVSAARLLE